MVPLMLSKKSNLFKLFMNDVGLLSATYMDGIQLRILNGETDINFGSVYENVIAQELVAHGFPLFYFSSREHGEVDFIVERMGKVLPVEVKSGKHYQRHRALNRIMDVPDYAIQEAVVLDDDVHKVESGIHYAPVYMAMFLEHESLPEKMPYEIGEPIRFRPLGT